MKIIPVDYNAASVSGSLWLDFADTKRALAAINAQAGDYVWVSDREILVGAQLEVDPEYGLVAVPRWRTVVHLDDYLDVDLPSFLTKLSEVLRRTDRTLDQEAEVFQLSTVFDHIAPPEIKRATQPGYLDFRSAGALRSLGEPQLGLTLLKQALIDRPTDPQFIYAYLNELSQIHPAQAEAESRSRLLDRYTHAVVQAACVNVLSAATERLNDIDFAATGPPLLDEINRFESAPGRDRVPAGVAALVEFNRGLLLLRLGRSAEARAAFDQAHEIDPGEPTIEAARTLRDFGETARTLAERYRGKPIQTAA